MSQAFIDNFLSIGHTLLVKLSRIVPKGAEVYAKIEGLNPAYSVKCRIGAAMIWAAEKQGLLGPGKKIVAILPDSDERCLSSVLFEGIV